jgi:hypothetical protein
MRSDKDSDKADHTKKQEMGAPGCEKRPCAAVLQQKGGDGDTALQYQAEITHKF